MHYQSDGTQVTTRPTPGAVTGTPGYVQAGNPTTGVQPTIDDPDLMNAIMDELCNIVLGAGGTLSKTNNAQVLAAIHSLIAAYAQPLLGYTAANLASFNANLAANGFQPLPSGLLIQWGTSFCPSNNLTASSTTVTFPIAFPLTCRAVVGSAANPCYLSTPGDPTTGSSWPAFSAGSITTTGFKAVVDNFNTQSAGTPPVINQDVAFTYVAIGS